MLPLQKAPQRADLSSATSAARDGEEDDCLMTSLVARSSTVRERHRGIDHEHTGTRQRDFRDALCFLLNLSNTVYYLVILLHSGFNLIDTSSSMVPLCPPAPLSCALLLLGVEAHRSAAAVWVDVGGTHQPSLSLPLSMVTQRGATAVGTLSSSLYCISLRASALPRAETRAGTMGPLAMKRRYGSSGSTHINEISELLSRRPTA